MCAAFRSRRCLGPYSTMQRFDAFLGQEAALAKFDYLFFANANLHCTSRHLRRRAAARTLPPDRPHGSLPPALLRQEPMFHPTTAAAKAVPRSPTTAGSIMWRAG